MKIAAAFLLVCKSNRRGTFRICGSLCKSSCAQGGGGQLFDMQLEQHLGSTWWLVSSSREKKKNGWLCICGPRTYCGVHGARPR